MKYCRSLLFFSAGLAAPLLTAQQVALFPEADAGAEPVAVVSWDDPRFSEGSPVPDEAMAAEGWYWGEFTGRFEGHVPDAKIGKDLLPVEGTFIHAEPDEDSRILTTVSAEDIGEERIEIVERGVWWTVAFTKPVPVFYREAIISAEPVAEPTESEREQVRPLLMEPAPAAPEPPAPIPEAAPPAEPEFQATPEPVGHDFVAGSIGASLRGTLQRAGNRFFVFPPPYPFELLDVNGKRVAYVDFSKAILQRPVSAYLGETVNIFGPWEKIDGSRTIVIRARNLRPSF